MLEFAVPGSVSGMTTVKIWGSIDVPVGYEDAQIGSSLLFRVRVDDPGLSVATFSAFTLAEAPELSASFTTSPDFYGALEIDAGTVAGKSLYVAYGSFEAFGAPGATTTVFQVTMSNNDSPIRPNIGFKSSGSRGRFL